MMLPVKSFNDYITLNALFPPGSKILAAVSGGMDSVLMAHLLKAAGFNFSIAHCNFQLRGDDALADQDFCQRVSQQLQVQFHTTNFHTGAYAAHHHISIQMAARELRYQWFHQLKQQYNYDVIALAHHQNDAIETILLNLTRGTGVAGLHGILPKNGDLVRPMLFLTRNEIEDIVSKNSIEYVEDSSNASVKYARNKLRHEVIPKLKELNPALEATFEKNLQHFNEMEQLLEHNVAKLKKELFSYHGDEVHIAIGLIKKLEPKGLLVFKLLQPYGFNRGVINDLINALYSHPGKTFESPGYLLLLDRDKLILAEKQAQQCEPISIERETHEVNYGRYKILLLHDDSPLIVKDNPWAVAIDAGLLSYPLTIRTWQQGDRFYPLGMKTSKKLSDFFIQQKIPLTEKAGIPVLTNGNGEIMWIAGLRLSERYKVSDNTKKVTIFELVKVLS